MSTDTIHVLRLKCEMGPAWHPLRFFRRLAGWTDPWMLAIRPSRPVFQRAKWLVSSWANREVLLRGTKTPRDDVVAFASS
jgi:hypothetical protein